MRLPFTTAITSISPPIVLTNRKARKGFTEPPLCPDVHRESHDPLKESETPEQAYAGGAASRSVHDVRGSEPGARRVARDRRPLRGVVVAERVTRHRRDRQNHAFAGWPMMVAVTTTPKLPR